MVRALLSFAAALTVAALVAALAGCGRTPPPLSGGLESPPPPPPAKTGWTLYTDQERIVDIAPGPGVVWAVSQNGVLSWTRPGRQVKFETGPDAPGADSTAVAVAGDGTVYVGLAGGIAWRRPEPNARWERLTVDPLHAGVTALAPRRAGGVWVGLQRGLGWMNGGRLRVHTRSHTIRDLAVDATGRVWAATARNGLITVEGDRIVEHTTVSGLCGNEIRSVATGDQGQVAVVCATPQPSVAFRIRNTWRRYTLTRGGAAIQGVQWHVGSWVIRAAGAWWRVVERPIGTPYDADDPAARLEPMETAGAPPPPLPVAVASRALTAEGSGPVAPPPVEDVLLPRTRLTGPEGNAESPPDLRLLPARPALPEEGEITVWHVGPDDFAWYGLAWRGVVAQKGSSVQRFTSQSLVPQSSIAQLAVDGKGRAMIPSDGPYIVRSAGSGWERRPIAPVGAPAQALAVAPDSQGGAWALVGYPPVGLPAAAAPAPVEVEADPAIAGIVAQPEGAAAAPVATPTPELALVRIEDARLERVAVFPVLGIAGALRVGHFRIGALGEANFALFYENDRGQLRGAGMGRVPVSHDRFERWPARRVMGETSDDGTPLLPDAWINALVRDPDGVVYLGTNAGLVRVKERTVRVFDENDFIESEVITALTRDAQGRIWAGHLEGLGRLQGEAWTTVDARGLGGRITALTIDARGRMWAGAADGAWIGDGESFQPIYVRPGEMPRDVRTIAHAPDGAVWMLTGQGVFHRPADAR
ncbi:MAG: hypothetical protein R3F65_00295 [bacterium]